MSNGDDKLLKLRAHDSEDLAVISALLQDALVPLGDITYLPHKTSFIMAMNRYRWERSDMRLRVHSGVRFDTVQRAQFSGIDQRNRRQFLSFMAMEFQPQGNDLDEILLHFSGEGRIRLQIDNLSCRLTDFDESWSTHRRPHHDFG
jgi:hypothetical protein